jgi:hypothetical protein
MNHNKTNNHTNLEEMNFFEDELYEAQRNLFSARSVKQIRFLQNRIDFLRQRVREVNGRRK